MKILFVLEYFYPRVGGAENLFWLLSSNLAKNGIEVKVITTLHDESLPLQEIVQGVEIQRIPCKNRYRFLLRSILPVVKAAKNVSLIHTTTYTAAIAGWIAGFVRRKPVFLTVHEVWIDLWDKLPFLTAFEKKAFKWYERLVLSLPFSRYVAVSDFTAQALTNKNIPTQKIARIYNGLDYKKFQSYQHQPPTNYFKLLFFGRLGVSKGFDILLPAVGEIIKKHPTLQFQMVIPDRRNAVRNHIEELIQKHDLTNNLQILHNLSQSQLYQTICTASAVVLPSYSEGFCFAAAETIALGVPLITSQKGALKEVVSGKYIFISSFSIEGTVKAIEKAIENKWTITPVKRFEINTFVETYKKLYTQYRT